MKHLLSSLGLALLLLAWGGSAVKADAQVQLQEVQTVNFDNDQADYIPIGWTVNNEGTVRASGTTLSDWKTNGENIDEVGGGPRLFNFANATAFKKALYLRTNSETASSAQYGDVEGYELSLPAGYVEIQVSAVLWDTKTGSLKVEVFNSDLSATVASTTQALSVQTGSDKQNAAVSETDIVPVHFMNATKGNYVIKVSTTAKWNEFAIAGFTVYNDPLAVLVEDFSDVADNYTPAVGSGWSIYAGSTTPKEKGLDCSSKKGTRVFTLGSSVLKHAMYHEAYGYDATKYEIYGEAADDEPSLILEAGKYQISMDAAIWTGEPDIRIYLLDSEGAVVASSTKSLTATSGGSRTADFTPETVTLTAEVESAGDYMLKVTSAGQILYGNIAIRKDLTTALSETFSGLSNAVPATGWIVYNNGAARTQGATNISGGARAFAISGFAAITNVAYMGWQGSCYLTYGEENSGKTLTLVAGKEYRITYCAANWDGNTASTRSMKCEIIGNDNQGTIFSREDVLFAKCNGDANNGAKFLMTPDLIQATFTPEKSGNYTLKFTSTNTVLGNISIQLNSDQVVYETSLDKFGFTTLCLDQAVKLPEGVTAYTGALNDDNSALILEALEGEAIPANTGVILQGEAGAALTFYPAEETVASVANNALLGTLVGTKSPLDQDIYILGYKTNDETSSFYKNSTKSTTVTVVTSIEGSTATIQTTTSSKMGSEVTGPTTETKTEDYVVTTDESTNKTTYSHTAGTKTTTTEYVRVIPANKAYLAITPASDQSNVSAIRIQFGSDETEPGNVTAIEQIEVTPASTSRVIYDLSGRRLTEMTKPGLYIVGGRKVMVR